MTATQSRVVGSNFTTMRWRGQPIAFLQDVSDTGQAPVARPEVVQGIGDKYPVEIAVPNALGAGALSFTIKELWNKSVWQHLSGMASAQNILDVWTLIRGMPEDIVCQMVIRNPNSNIWRTKTYYGVVVTEIDDSESIAIASMTVNRAVGAMYTHALRGTVAAST